MSRLLPMFGLMLLLGSAGAEESPPKLPFYAIVQVEVDAGGHATVGEVDIRQVKPDSLVATVAIPALKRRMAGWAFVPAVRNGMPVPSETNVTVRMEARGDGKGNMVMFVLDAQTGARAVSLDPPHYPNAMAPPLDEGLVVLRVGYDADGEVDDVVVDKSEAPSGAARNRFKRASVEAARQWRFEPERIAGVGIPGEVRIPVSFCAYARCPYADDARTMEEKLVTLDPAVSLRTAVAGTAL